MNNVIEEIRKKQDAILMMVNSSFDEIIREVSILNSCNNEIENEYEITYPITNTAGFKGKKVIAVLINNERIIAPTWKSVVKIVLLDVIKNEEKKNNLLNLRDRILGRQRNRLSSNPDDMRSPLQINDEIYIETHYDTESLMKLLLQILNDISYDYSNIKIVIKN